MTKRFPILVICFLLSGCGNEFSGLSYEKRMEFDNLKKELESFKTEKSLWEKDRKVLQDFRDRYDHVKLSLYDDFVEINRSFAPDDSKESAKHHLFIPKDIKTRMESLSKKR